MAIVLSDDVAAKSPSSTVKVWDLFVRVAHWTVAVAFFMAYFTEDDLLTLHVWAGYTVGVFVVLRVLWGFVGPRHARFSDFLYSPFKICTYLLELMTFRGKRYLGHSPAGGAMTIVLLIGLAATVWTGLELYAAEKNAGPLAAISNEVASASTDGSKPSLLLRVSDDDYKREGRRGDRADGAGEFWEELHEVLANIMLVLVIIHIGGVLLASVVHSENLPIAMITGRKRPD
jgi:cytochrome b